MSLKILPGINVDQSKNITRSAIDCAQQHLVAEYENAMIRPRPKSTKNHYLISVSFI